MIKSVKKNALILGAAEMFNIACGIVIVIALARVLGVAEVGLFSFAYSVGAIIFTMSFFGMNDYIVRAAAKEPAKAGEYFYNVMAGRTALIIAGMLLLEAALRIAGYPPVKKPVFYLLISTRIVESLLITLFAFFRAFQKMHYEGLIRAVLYSTSLTASLFVIFGCKNIMAFAVTQLSIYLLFFFITLFAAISFISAITPILSFSAAGIFALIKGSFNISFVQMLIAVYVQMNTILLNFIKGDEATGIYAAGFRFVSVFGVLVMSLIQAVFPALSKIASEKNPARLNAAFVKVQRHLFWIAFPLCSAMFILAPQLINLIYGAKFKAAVIPLYIMAFTPVFMFFNAGNNYLLYALDKEKLYMRVLMIMITAAIALNLVLIPAFGAIGAAMTTIIPEALFFVLLTITVKKTLREVK